jgi:hypothetical protein
MKAIKFYFFVAIFAIFAQAVKAQDKGINNVLNAYFAVKNDLATDNAAIAKSHATELITAIKAVPADRIPTEQQAAWKKIQWSTARIAEAKDIDTQRDYFAVLSENLIVVNKALKANATTVYQQYCPMKKVSWLSEAVAIKNPYYGKQMPTCGQVTETLAAAVK